MSQKHFIDAGFYAVRDPVYEDDDSDKEVNMSDDESENGEYLKVDDTWVDPTVPIPLTPQQIIERDDRLLKEVKNCSVYEVGRSTQRLRGLFDLVANVREQSLANKLKELARRPELISQGEWKQDLSEPTDKLKYHDVTHGFKAIKVKNWREMGSRRRDIATEFVGSVAHNWTLREKDRPAINRIDDIRDIDKVIENILTQFKIDNRLTNRND